jgi:hypothetical protein
VEIFTEVYKKSTDLLKNQSLETNWKAVEDSLKVTLKPLGPDASHGIGLQACRDHLTKIVRDKGSSATAKADASLPANRQRLVFKNVPRF